MHSSVQTLILTLLGSERESLTVEEGMAEANGHPSPSRSEVVEAMKRLEAAGHGRFVSGRRGYHSRFKIERANSSPGEDISFQTSDSSEEPRVTPAAPQGEVAEYTFPLRHGFTASLRLPTTISPSEADRLSQFIQLLVVAPSEA